MPHTELHKTKKKKNIMVFGLILLWCALIFMISIIKMANANENPMTDSRFAHQQKSATALQQWNDDFQNKGDQRQKTRESRELFRLTHANQIKHAQDQWLENWHEAKSTRFQEENTNFERRTSHYETTLPRQQEWWNSWTKRQQEKREQ